MSELDLDFVNDLERFFKTEQDIGHNTNLKYMSYTKKITNIALRRGYLRGDPFNGYKRLKHRVDPTCLTWKELKKLENKSFHADRIQRVADVFVFACYTGLAYSDLAGLQHSNFYEDKDGDLWLRKARQKTEEPAKILVTSKPKAILEKYEDWGTPLPVISNQKMNSYLKEIGDFCGFDKELHCHVARHTFATTVTLEMGVPPKTVQLMLGHKQFQTTEHYARVTNRKATIDQKMWRKQLAEYGVS